MLTLKKGMVLYHGTDALFDEQSEGLHGPVWVSSSITVAEHFARLPGGFGGVKRIIKFRLAKRIELNDIHSPREMLEFAEEHGIGLYGVDDMKEGVESSGIAGWIIPNNYPDGDDILIADASVLEHVETHVMD